MADTIFDGILVIVLVFLLLVIAGMLISLDPNTRLNVLETQCSKTWADFETKLVDVSGGRYICQVNIDGNWIPESNISIPLN